MWYLPCLCGMILTGCRAGLCTRRRRLPSRYQFPRVVDTIGAQPSPFEGSPVTAGWVPGAHSAVVDCRSRDTLPVHWTPFVGVADVASYAVALVPVPQPITSQSPLSGRDLDYLVSNFDGAWTYVGLSTHYACPLTDLPTIRAAREALVAAVYAVDVNGIKSAFAVSPPFWFTTEDVVGSVDLDVQWNAFVDVDGREGNIKNGGAPRAVVTWSLSRTWSRSKCPAPVVIGLHCRNASLTLG